MRREAADARPADVRGDRREDGERDGDGDRDRTPRGVVGGAVGLGARDRGGVAVVGIKAVRVLPGQRG